jgi:hypothetical protein
MSGDYNQHQKPTSKDSLQVETEKNDFNPDWDAMAVLVEENQRLAKHLSELKDWEAVAADQAMTIAMMKQREWVGLTDDEIRSICNESYVMLGAYAVDFIKAIEAKLKEKNT